MAPRPTKTPLFSHQTNTSNYPIPQHSNQSRNNIQSDDISAAFSDENILNPDNKPVYHRSKSCFRWWVLFLSCWAMFGSYYCYDNPTALANQIKEEYSLTNTEYNLLYTVYSIPNIVLPLFGGALVDKIGAESSLLVFLCFVTAGQALFAFAASISSYPLMLTGRALFGLGGESLCVAESALLAVYFIGTEVAFAMGLNLSLGRAGSSLNDFATLRIYNINNSIPEALWAGFILLCICLAATLIMVVLDRIKAKQKVKKGYFVPQAHSGEVVKLSDIREFNILYWLLTVSCIVVYGCVLPWNNIGSAFMQAQYGYSSEKGNNYLMLPYLISTFCVPFFGYICDRVGRRAELLVMSTSALTIAHGIFAFLPSVDPLLPLALMGVSYSIYASAIWPAVALVVKESKLGTAYGFITSVQNGGLALIPVMVGQLTLSDGDPDKEYFYVEILFFGLGFFGVLVGTLLLCLDNKSGSKLAAPSIQKDKEDAMEQKLIVNNDNESDANLSLQTPELMYEHKRDNLEHTPIVLAKNISSAV